MCRCRGVSNIEDAIEDRSVASSVSLSRTQSRIALVVNNYKRPKFCPLRRSIADECERTAAFQAAVKVVKNCKKVALLVSSRTGELAALLSVIRHGSSKTVLYGE